MSIFGSRQMNINLIISLSRDLPFIIGISMSVVIRGNKNFSLNSLRGDSRVLLVGCT